MGISLVSEFAISTVTLTGQLRVTDPQRTGHLALVDVRLVYDDEPRIILTAPASVSTSGLLTIAAAIRQVVPLTAPASISSAGSLTLTLAGGAVLVLTAPATASTVGSISAALAARQQLTFAAPPSVSTIGTVNVGTLTQALNLAAPASVSNSGDIAAVLAARQSATISAPASASNFGDITAAKSANGAITITAPLSVSTTGAISSVLAARQQLSVAAPASVSTAGSVAIASAGGVFTPATISNLEVWLDASDTSSITDTAGSVSQWNDKSGNANHFTATDQPLTGFETVNGLNTVYFNDSAWMVGPASLHTLPNGSNTVLCVVKQNDTNPDRRVWAGTSGAGSRWAVYMRTNYEATNNTAYSPVTLPIVNRTSLHCIGLRRDGASMDAIYDGTINTGPANSVIVDSVQIGRFPPLNNNKWLGPMCEICVYSKRLTNAELNEIGGYLATKWGFAWNTVT